MFKVMPTYGYECKSCAHTFDAFQNMADEPLRICPQCGKELRRLIHGGSGVIFKGSGFYVTDKSGSKTASGKSASSGAKPEGAAPPAACPGCAASSQTGACPNTAAKAANA